MALNLCYLYIVASGLGETAGGESAGLLCRPPWDPSSSCPLHLPVGAQQSLKHPGQWLTPHCVAHSGHAGGRGFYAPTVCVRPCVRRACMSQGVQSSPTFKGSLIIPLNTAMHVRNIHPNLGFRNGLLLSLGWTVHYPSSLLYKYLSL